MKVWNPEPALKRLRALGRTRRWLADESEIKLSYLHQVLSGRLPSDEAMERLAYALDTSVQKLLSEAIPAEAESKAS